MHGIHGKITAVFFVTGYDLFLLFRVIQNCRIIKIIVFKGAVVFPGKLDGMPDIPDIRN